MKQALTKVARKMQAAVPGAGFELKLWDEDVIRLGDTPQFTLWFKTQNALARTVKNGFLGFGEGYMYGDIEVDGDLQLLLQMGSLAGVGDNALSFPEMLRFLLFALTHRNTQPQSRKNISHHYDVGNDLYRLFLDETMSYSCAYFTSPDNSLEQAQRDKYANICRKLMLQPGESFADLGCGWGGLLIYAAQHHGIRGIGATLSAEQHAFASTRIEALGLSDRIEVKKMDYRDVRGRFDKVASVGMLEHVGKGYIKIVAQKYRDILKPGGLGLLHFIGNDTPYPDDPWTAKYIFPGYHAPVLAHVALELSKAQQSIVDIENLRMHYVWTIRHWLERYERHREKIIEMKDLTFFRAWQLYLNIGIASFEVGGNRLFQILFTNGLNNSLPLTRAHLYAPPAA